MTLKCSSDLIIFEPICGGYDSNTDNCWWTYYWSGTIYTVIMPGELLREINQYTKKDYVYLLCATDEVISGFILSIVEMRGNDI